MNCGGIFDLVSKKQDLEELRTKSLSVNFWDDNTKATSVLRKISRLEHDLDLWANLEQRHDDLEVLFEFVKGGDATPEDITSELDQYSLIIDKVELQLMLGNPNDTLDAILTIHPGAGGTESQDWAVMLYRLYIRWAERTGFKTKILDFQPGDEAGIKDVTIEIKGEYAYGLLKAEAGVHRLVRITPFDAAKLRHTSFASVFV